MRVKKSVAAFIFTALVLSIGFCIGSMFPFGNGTISWCDMNQQGIPLLCDFKDILEGKDGMFLNFHNASGMNFYGVFFFFLASPFSFLCVFVDKIDIPYLINVIVVLKLALSALTASVYFSKRFKGLSFIENIALSASYGLCGYGMLFFQNVMWLDVMYMLPLLMLGIYKLINEDKALLFTISLTLILIMNYYISYMVILFVILYFGVLTVRRMYINKNVYINLGVCTLSSLLMSAVVLIPCYLQYTKSARGEDVISGIINANFFGSTYTTVPVMLCTALIFAVLLHTIPNLYGQNKYFKFDLIVFALLCVPLLIEPVNLMWHTGSYMSFPARFAFITVFIGLCLVANWLENRETNHTNSFVHLLIIIGLVGIITYVMYWYTNENIHTLTEYVATLWGNRDSFRGLIILSSFGIIGYLLVLVFYKDKRISRLIFSLLLCVLVFVEGLCSVNIYMNSAKDKFNYQNYAEFINLQNLVDDDDEFYRVNLDEKFIDANMTGAIGFNSIGHYTSLNNQDTMRASKQFGYSGYWMETGNWGGNILSDALLSVKYTAIFDDGEYVMRENPYFLSMGIKSKVTLPSDINDKNRFEEIGKLFAQITNTDNSVRSFTPSNMIGCYYEQFDDEYIIGRTSEVAQLIYDITVTEKEHLYFDCYNGFSNNLTETINQSLAVFVDGYPVITSYPTQRENGFLDLGVFEDCNLQIVVKVFENINATSFGLYGINENTVTNAINNCETLNLVNSGGCLVGNVKTGGTYFLSVPYSEDLRITLDGEDVEFSKALTGFVSIELNGEGKLEVSSVPSGFIAGIIISVIGLAIAVLWFLYLKNKVKNRRIDLLVLVLFCIVFALMILAVYILPVTLNLFA